MMERPKPNWNLQIRRKKEGGGYERVKITLEQAQALVDLSKLQPGKIVLTRDLIIKKFNEKFPENKISIQVLHTFKQNNKIRFEYEGAVVGKERTAAMAHSRGKTRFVGPVDGSRNFNRRHFGNKNKKENKDE